MTGNDAEFQLARTDVPTEAREALLVERHSEETASAGVLVESWDGSSINQPSKRTTSKRKFSEALWKTLNRAADLL